MALVIEESEDISLELLTPILASVKKDDEVNLYSVADNMLLPPQYY